MGKGRKFEIYEILETQHWQGNIGNKFRHAGKVAKLWKLNKVENAEAMKKKNDRKQLNWKMVSTLERGKCIKVWKVAKIKTENFL